MRGINQLRLVLAFIAAWISPSIRAEQLTGLNLFEQKIRPALSEHCYKCHSTKANKFKGGLALDERERILKGGDSGPVIVPNKPEESLLIKAIRHSEKDLEMPPEEKLPEELIGWFENWIRLGAPLPEVTDRAAGARAELPAWWESITDSDLLPRGIPIETAVDFYIDANLEKQNVRPAAEADDVTVVRRLSLDLVGRIPTALEAIQYERSQDLRKRAQLIERLIESPEFVRHQVTEFDWLLMDGKGASFREYLARAFQENRKWDQIFKEVLSASARLEESKGAEVFLKTRVRDLDRLVNDVSVRFFGVNISCAQCHDHPLVPSWKQDHYYGMKSFFSRTFENGDFLGEREYGFVSFKTTAGENKRAKLMFLTGDSLDEPDPAEWTDELKKQEKQQLEELKKKKEPPPPPKFSRRALLVEAGLKQGQEGFFARAIVNQLWNRFFGVGLVMPLDQMHGQNRPSHPELVQWLARDFAEHDYDVKRLIRGLVSSAAYVRSSRWSGEKEPNTRDFAVAIPRPLTPQQYGASLVVAAISPRVFAPGKNRDDLKPVLERIEKSGLTWANFFERHPDNFQVGMDEALLLSNNDKVQNELLGESEDQLVKDLAQLQNSQQIIQLAVWNVLCRPPRPDELRIFDDYLARRSSRRTDAIRQVVWALMASTEFRFNH